MTHQRIHYAEAYDAPIAQFGPDASRTCTECGLIAHPAFGPVLDLNCSHMVHVCCFDTHVASCTHPTDEERLAAWIAAAGAARKEGQA